MTFDPLLPVQIALIIAGWLVGSLMTAWVAGYMGLPVDDPPGLFIVLTTWPGLLALFVFRLVVTIPIEFIFERLSSCKFNPWRACSEHGSRYANRRDRG